MLLQLTHDLVVCECSLPYQACSKSTPFFSEGCCVHSRDGKVWFGPNHEPDLNTDKGHLEVAQLIFGRSDVDVNLKDRGP